MPPRTILVVDDSPVSQMMVQTILRSAGFTLLKAEDGHEALQIAERNRPDLIIMDVSMPQMDGVTALRELRSRDTTRAIPVLMLTAEGAPGQIDSCFRAGCDAYLTKPVNSGALRDKVEELLSPRVET